ncbi:M64 family metallopeptidase [Streptomyces sp. LP05-1]|uniref:M64 family metallopeptidase n=1 Tax=Streptomyces pyxinae TaxID=2970734 RepID=A0ABT2CJQ2_9ACTN|nr:M64 family metallopeptidase [Streptomyces sp. LP05-1]MCS0636946.1 M64 family metallopeptidase [Streptomyces sp. LP05-1]
MKSLKSLRPPKSPKRARSPLAGSAAARPGSRARRLTTAVLTGAVATTSLVLAAPRGEATPGPTAAPAAAATEHREVFSPDGSIRTVAVTPPKKAGLSAGSLKAAAAATVEPVEVNGPSSSKVDLVFVGDGYTSAQLDSYRGHVRSKVNELFAVEPFKSYRSLFNIWQVNVVSRESGVDDDPSQGVRRDTALDMNYYCGGTARLLCVNEAKAAQYAAQAPAVDQVVALANSTTYGGAGGTAATAAGGNAQAGQIVVHELGHSLGGLADEYDSPGRHQGGEEPEQNVSVYPQATMKAYQLKWYRWLGQPTPDGGTIGTFEGAKYAATGIYRPSQNSIMRTLGREFNAPSREAMIAAFYRKAGVAAKAPAVRGAAGGERLAVAPQRPDGRALTVSWRIDGRPYAHTGGSLDTARIPAGRLAGKGPHRITATVTDPTPWVRDPELRSRDLTRTFEWTVRR